MTTPELTKNQSLVFHTLSDAKTPLTAYVILEQLRDEGFSSPLQVYRALDKLVGQNRVHRLESINSFVACAHECCTEQAAAVFAICEKCGKVSEFADAKLARHVKAWARSDGFQLNKTTIELRGECQACSNDCYNNEKNEKHR
ncbi:MAG: Fur family transcriptional regulator [Rhizobiaceae bacterium]